MQTVSQWTNSTYVLTCDGPGGMATQSVTVVSPSITVTANDAGFIGFFLGGEPFVPIGVNYLLEGPPDAGKQTFDMFDSRYFDLSTLDANLKTIAADGFTYVRLWLKGADTDNGFTSPDAGDQTAWQLYVGNVVATVQTAEKYGLHVVLTGSFPGPSGDLFTPLNYALDAGPILSQVTGMNQLLLIPVIGQQLGAFYRDLLTAMLARDPNIGSALFYFDLYNEVHYQANGYLPFGLADGGFTYTVDGVATTYDLGNFTAEVSDGGYLHSRQALMDTAAQNFIATVGRQVTAVVPQLLVTASTPFNHAVNHDHFDGAQLDAGSASAAYAYVLRPYFVLQGGASLIDFHTYPSAGVDAGTVPILMGSNELVTPSTTLTGTLVNATVCPLISGEFGTYTSGYAPDGGTYATDLSLAIQEMQLIEQDAFCPYDVSGFGFWDWNTYPSDVFALVPPTPDGGQQLLEATAPLDAPQFCGQVVTK